MLNKNIFPFIEKCKLLWFYSNVWTILYCTYNPLNISFLYYTEDEKCSFLQNNDMLLKYDHLLCFVHCVELQWEIKQLLYFNMPRTFKSQL